GARSGGDEDCDYG
nr:immunoglobulin heavy chain junction region [Mus musculus]